MSAFKPENPKSKPPATLTEELVRMSPRDWILSAVLHAIAFALLFWLTPLHDIVTEAIQGGPKDPAAKQAAATPEPLSRLAQDPEKIEQAAKAIEADQAEKARERVVELLASEKKLEDLAKEKIKAYEQETAERAQAVAEQALDHLKKTTDSQEKAAKDQQAIAEKIQKLTEKVETALPKKTSEELVGLLDEFKKEKTDLEKLQEELLKTYREIALDQTKAAKSLEPAEKKIPEAVEAQKKATEAQREAAISQLQASFPQKEELAALEKLIEQMKDAPRSELPPETKAELEKQKKDASETLEKSQAAQALAKQQQTKAVQKLTNVTEKNLAEQIQKSAEAAAKALENLETTTEQQAQAVKEQSQLNEQILSVAKKTEAALTAKTSKERATAQTELKTASEELTQSKKALQQTQSAIAQDQSKATEALKPAEKQIPAAAAAQQTATETQQRASESPKEVTQILEQLTKKTLAVPPDADGSSVKASLDAQKAKIQESIDVNQRTQALAQTQQAEAVKQLTAIAELKTQMPADKGAADKPSLETKTLAELYDLAREAEANATKHYQTFRAAELAAIVDIPIEEAKKSLNSVKPIRAPSNPQLPTAPVSPEKFEAFKKEVVQAAQQIAAMNVASKSLVATAEAQQKAASGPIDASRLKQLEELALANNNQRGKDMSGLMRDLQNADRDADNASEGKNNPGEIQGKNPARKAPELPNMDYANIKPLVTRSFASGGTQRADWLAIQSWYIIGPFPNYQRSNLHAKFPPESVVDLDAVYSGKNGEPVRWKFKQNDRPMVRPDNDTDDAPAVYYAYTELFFDEPQDLWAAIGTDDQGILWVNDLMVWNSGDELKPWIANEAYRRIHFSKGRNRVLYRVENGRVIAAFSLIISAKE